MKSIFSLAICLVFLFISTVSEGSPGAKNHFGYAIVWSSDQPMAFVINTEDDLASHSFVFMRNAELPFLGKAVFAALEVAEKRTPFYAKSHQPYGFYTANPGDLSATQFT